MAVRTTIDPENGLVTHTITGELRIEDIRKGSMSLFSDPDFRPEMAILVDIRQGTATGLTPADIKELVDITRALDDRRGSGRTAILAERHGNIGIGRLLQALLDSTERKIGVFRDEAAASDWLYRRSDVDHS